jgi:general stress protein YciG
MPQQTPSPLHGRAACLATIVTLCIAAAAAAENLLVNSDFNQGQPSQENFGWRLDLAADQHSECALVDGRGADSRTLRIYNDELGGSFINQTIDVRPWRWYVAEVWVKSDGMYSPDVRVSLQEGRRRGQWQYVMDYFDKPPPGWRVVRAYDHSGDSERLTLTIGGPAFSGELLISEPVVRECSLVEAVSYHAKPNARQPGVYGPPVDAAQGLPGYAFLRSDIRRVARDFPNALRISMDLPEPRDPEGRCALWLPPGIRFLKLRPHGGGKNPPTVTQLPGGPHAPGGTHLELQTGRGESNLLVESDLEPGERATGYVSYEWNGGYQLPRQVVFEGVELPHITAPRRIVTALDAYGAAYLNWEGVQPGLSGQQAMVRDLQRMGFNRLQLWGGDARPYAQLGIEAGASYGGSFAVDLEKYPDSGAVTLGGQRTSKVMCPSYRGPGFRENEWVERLRETAAFTSSVNLDDEVYLMSGVGPDICFCDRCVQRWDAWVEQQQPSLAGITPQEFFRRAHKYPQHFEAWVRFRCELVAERFGILREVFHAAVEESGVKTTAEPELGAFTDEVMLAGLSSGEALSKGLDFISPMIYLEGDGVRQQVARLAPVTGGKLIVCLAPGYDISPPGDARSQVLETVMGGARGFVAWNLDIGPITTGQLADMSEAIKMFAPVEDIILDGRLETGYVADRDSTNLLARTRGGESVLLVSDYSPGARQVTVTVPGQASQDVVDLFTDEVTARLNATDRTFVVRLQRDFQARLYHLHIDTDG